MKAWKALIVGTVLSAALVAAARSSACGPLVAPVKATDAVFLFIYPGEPASAAQPVFLLTANRDAAGLEIDPSELKGAQPKWITGRIPGSALVKLPALLQKEWYQSAAARGSGKRDGYVFRMGTDLRLAFPLYLPPASAAKVLAQLREELKTAPDQADLLRQLEVAGPR